MDNLKIRNTKNKIEINGLIYCMGENEVFTGIFMKMVNYFKKKYLNTINMANLKRNHSK